MLLILAVKTACAVPQLDATGQQAYRNFLAAQQHKAFAIAPGGYWSWLADQSTIDAAKDGALHACHELAAQGCTLYALDQRVVFDAARWKRSWRPYLSQAEAAQAPMGIERGQRFPDLSFKDVRGKPLDLSSLQGKVVVLHFWGSWCPACRTELPDLAKLQRMIARTQDVRLVLLQVREDFVQGKNWLREQGLKLPLYDSGMQNSRDDVFRLSDGNGVRDREIAPVFPTTYVLDKHGIVLFSHVGSISDWPGYLPLLQDAARYSGNAVSRPLPSR